MRPSFAFATLRVGAHVEVAVRHGLAGQRALLGKLVMRDGEWAAFSQLLLELQAEGPLNDSPFTLDPVAALAELRRLRSLEQAVQAVTAAHEAIG